MTRSHASETPFVVGLSAAALAALVAFGLADRPGPSAQTVTAPMTDEARAALREEIRAYLLEEPELIVEALRALDARKVAQARTALDAKVASGDLLLDLGSADGDLTLVEFTDYDCPYCRAVQPEVIAFVAEDGKVRHVVEALPFIGEDTAERAAIAAKMQGDPAKLAAFHAAMMGSPSRHSTESILAMAADAGFDVERLERDMASPDVDAAFERNVEIARALQIQGTPAFVMGEAVFTGRRPKSEFVAIAAELRAGRPVVAE